MTANGIILPTEKAFNDLGSDLPGRLNEIVSSTRTLWEEDIEDGNNKYSLDFTSAATKTVELSEEPNDPNHALQLSQQAVVNQRQWYANNYSVRVVFDTRDVGLASGVALVGTAGTNYAGTCWINNEIPKTATPHEIGHLFGAQHNNEPGDFESTSTHHSIMGKAYMNDCNGNFSATIHGDWFSNCARSVIRSHDEW